MKKYLHPLFCSIGLSVFGQEVSFTVLDSLTKESIPFATISTNFKQNSITNEEGVFRLSKDQAFTLEDSLFISSIGFKSFAEALLKIKDSVIYLPQKTIELNNVILSQNNLSAEEIIKRVRQNVDEKYDLSLTKKLFFMRESFYQEWDQLQMNLKKSTIKEFNQSFWDSLFLTLPKKDSWHTESLGELNGDWSRKNQKLHLIRAVDLADTLKEKGYDQIDKKLTSILEKSVKEKSYFKIKSGLFFSTKLDRNELIDQVLDSLPADSSGLAKKALEEEKLKGNFHKYRQRKLGNFFEGLVKKNKLNFNVLEKASWYTFEIMNFTFIEDIAVYQIKFEPKSSKAKFKGTLYVDADNYALIQLNYENVKPLKDFSLLGVSLKVYRSKILLKFAKFNGTNYQLQFYEREVNYKVGVERPIKFLEKNKYVKGRRKQNELNADLNIKLDQGEKFTLIIFENTPLTQEEFEQIKPQKGFKQDKLNAYDPNYWRDYTIVEPNEVIRSFKANTN